MWIKQVRIAQYVIRPHSCQDVCCICFLSLLRHVTQACILSHQILIHYLEKPVLPHPLYRFTVCSFKSYVLINIGFISSLTAVRCVFQFAVVYNASLHICSSNRGSATTPSYFRLYSWTEICLVPWCVESAE